MQRRRFLTVTALSAAVPLAASGASAAPGEARPIGKLRPDEGPVPIDGARWYVAEALGDGLAYQFPAGALAAAKSLTADMLLDGSTSTAFVFSLREGARGRAFRFSFGALNQCGLRIRLDLSLVDQRSWMVDREGAFLKPLCAGDRVDLDKVDRLTLTILHKGPKPSRFCMTPLRALAEMPPRMADPVLPKGPLLDELGQSTLTDWKGRTRSAAELTARIRGQYEAASKQSWPAGFTRWGGWKARKLGDAAGFFRTRREGGRWWLVDPDGYAFWSAGADCVRVDSEARFDGVEKALTWTPEAPEFADAIRGAGRRGGKSANFLAANMIRSFGREGWREKWAATALGEMKRLRFNTVGNWSEWRYAAQAKFPYVVPMSFRGARSGMVYRDFPDVFHAAFEQDAADYAAPLRETASDPALIGYFLMNEPTWAFSTELPAAGMLYNTESCATRDSLARFLRSKYDGDAALARAWAAPATFDQVARGRWRGVLSPSAIADLRDFSLKMVERYFQVISKACKQADPNHLNLGMRWQGIPKDWAVPGMKAFDVFSLNCYQERLPAATAEKIANLLGMPVLVGEWHFGALDVGLPASGIGHLKDQADRARAYRIYLEDAAAGPNCVGVHWFTLYDQSALGRFDGENYNIGFFDVCHRAYEEMGRAAIASHERMYDVAAGRAKPFDEPIQYLPKVFL
jgi:hypothetical protein